MKTRHGELGPIQLWSQETTACAYVGC